MRAILCNAVFLFVEPKHLVDFVLGTLTKDDYLNLRIDLYAKIHKKPIVQNTRRHIIKEEENILYMKRWARYVYFVGPAVATLKKKEKHDTLRIIGLLGYDNVPEKVLKHSMIVWACEKGEVEVVKHILDLPGELQLPPAVVSSICNCKRNQEVIMEMLLQDTRIDPVKRLRVQYLFLRSIELCNITIIPLLLRHPSVDVCDEAVDLAKKYIPIEVRADVLATFEYFSREKINIKKIKR